MLDKIQLYICIFAALVVGVVSVLQDTPLIVMVFRLIFFIILFYFVGLIVRSYLKRKVFIAKVQEETEEFLETDEELAPPAEDMTEEDEGDKII